MLGLFHARKLRAARARDRATRAGTTCTRGSAHEALLRPLHARRSRRATSRCAAGRPRPRAGLRRRLPCLSAAALAVVLHSHMPYVEGYGTWPFGEEWLWEAMASSYLPLLGLLRDGAPLTLSLTPVLCDQLEAPGVPERFRAFLTRHAPHDARARRRGLAHDGPRRPRRRDRARGRRLRARRSRRSMPPAATCSARWRRTPRGPAPRRTRCCRCSRRRRGPAAAADRDRRAPGAVRRAGTAASGCPSARTRRGSTRCSRRPACTPTCVDLTDVFGRGDARHLRPLPPRPDRCWCPSTARSWSSSGTTSGYPSHGAYRDYHHHTTHHHKPWAQRRRGLRPRARARRRPARDARRFVGARPRARRGRRAVRVRAGHRAAGALVVRGHRLAAHSSSRRPGDLMVGLDAALAELEPAPAPGELPRHDVGRRRATCRHGAARRSPTWRLRCATRSCAWWPRARAPERARCASCWRCRPPTGPSCVARGRRAVRARAPRGPPGRAGRALADGGDDAVRNLAPQISHAPLLAP